MLEYGTQEDQKSIVEELWDCTKELIPNQYGNYVIQNVIEKGKPADRTKMIKFVEPQFLTWSKHKYASNIVEKCMMFGSREDVSRMRQELSGSAGDKTSPLGMLVMDQYGNYVIRKCLFGQLLSSVPHSCNSGLDADVVRKNSRLPRR